MTPPPPPPVSPGLAAALAAGAALAWVAGSAAQLQMAALAGPAWVLALALAGALAVGLGWRRRGGMAGGFVLLAGVAMLAFALTHVRAQARLGQALPAALEGVDLELTGTVASLPRERLQGLRFDFAVESARLGGQPVQVPELVSLGWFRGADAGAWLGAPPLPVKAGQRWRFTARLARPHGAMNPQAFDLELWLWERGIRASGQVRARAGDPAVLLDAQAAHLVERLRQAVRDALFERVADPARAGVLAALAVGDQAAIARDDWALYRDTGVAHLMSISGLHVTMFAWLATALVAALWRLHPRAPLLLPAPVAGRWAGLALAAAYALVAGWGVPAQRTVAMLAVVVLLRHAGWRWPVPAVWLAAGTVVVVGDPWALLQPGFWLSFVAVGLLVASDPAQRAAAAAVAGWHRAWPLLRAALSQQAVATVGLAPLSLLFFQQLSLVGFVANLVAIPLVTLLITPLALLGLVLPPLWTLAAGVLALLDTLLQALAATPLAVWHAAAAPPWAVAAGLLAAVVAVLPWPWRLRALALPLMLPLLAPPVSRPPPGSFELLAADVGQGTAVVLRTAGHVLVYDTGAVFTPDADAGERVLVPLLRGLGVRRVDRLLLSHRDHDHTGGAASLMQALPVAATMSSLEPGHPLRTRAPHQPCTAGTRWQWDGVAFEILHPPAERLAAATPRTRANSLSCVLRVAGRQGSVLLAGDIEAAEEQALLRTAPAALASSVLLVPHHGSGTSSTPGFIAAVSPEVAVVQAGHRSRYGHPAPAVLARYAAAGVPVLTSAACGAWRWNGDAADAGVCVRQARRRYWHHPVSAGPELASPGCRFGRPGRTARPGEPAPCPSMSR